MVDHAIHAVSFKEGKQHIIQVKAFDVNGNTLQTERILTRADVVSLLKAKRAIKTLLRNGNSWVWGEDVRVMNYGGLEFIRTDNNLSAADNLGNLPEF